MKKALFFIVALAAVAIGCTKSEVIKAPGRGREVKFSTYVGKTPLTKAESADLAYVQRTLATGGGFQVYAFLHNYITPETGTPEPGEQVYNGDDSYVNVASVGTSTAYMDKVVTWVGPVAADPDNGIEAADGYWDYDGVVYWPDHTTSRKLAFAAWGLNVKDNITWDTDNTVAENEKSGHPYGQSYTKFTYTVPANVADQKDLLVAPFLPNQGLSENQDAKPVEISFKHLLSRVGFQVVANQNTNDVEIKIQEIKLIGKFPTTGKVDLKGQGVITPNTGDTDPFQEEYTFFPGYEYFVTTSNKIPTDIFANRIYVASQDETTEENGEQQEPTDEPEITDPETGEDEGTGENVNGGENGEEGGESTDDPVTPTPPVEEPETPAGPTGELVINEDASNRYLMIMPSQQAKHMVYDAEGAPVLDADGNVTYEEGHTLPGAYIEVHYQLTDADPQIARVSLDNWNFAAGKSYTFIFKVSTYSIEFDVDVESWNEHFAAVPEGGKPNEGNGYFTLTPIVQ